MADSPSNWTKADVDRFAWDAGLDEVISVVHSLRGQADEDAIRVLRLFLGARADDTMLKPVPSRAAVHALISLGEDGVEVLTAAIKGDGVGRVRYEPVIIESLFRASRGEPLPWTPAPGAPPAFAMDEGVRSAALAGIRAVLAEALIDPSVFFSVAQFAGQAHLRESSQQQGQGSGGTGLGRAIVDLLAESVIRISPFLIESYERLLAAGEREEVYQRFLADNPVFLDPLATEVIPKQRLGTDFATDFAVRRLDGRWLLVEIEKPQDPILTQAYDFSAPFTHAFGQVLDFQHWVDDNVAYAQKSMAGITAPRGLLITGSRSSLDSRGEAKLRRYVDNSARIDVMTFDDLLDAARSLYASLHG